MPYNYGFTLLRYFNKRDAYVLFFIKVDCSTQSYRRRGLMTFLDKGNGERVGMKVQMSAP